MRHSRVDNADSVPWLEVPSMIAPTLSQAAVSARYRDAIAKVLSDGIERSSGDLADLLGVPPNNVAALLRSAKSHFVLSRARRRLMVRKVGRSLLWRMAA